MGKNVALSYKYCRKCVLILINLLIGRADALCTWPAVFDSTTWLDSQQGQIVFTSSSEVSGFELQFYSQTVNTFTCIEEQFDTNKKLLIRSVSSANALGGDWYHYICLKFTELTAGVSYTYYRLNEQQADAGQHRTKPRLSSDAEFTIDNACDEANGATDSEFVTIVKQGSEADAFIMCPSVLLGRFEFNYTDSTGTESCNDPSAKEHMNVCTDKTKLAFDEPCTGKSIVYADGEVYCVASLQVGSDTFVQLYNPQAVVDSSSTYRFSCLAVSSDSLSSTIVYNNCTNHQTSSFVPRKHNGDVIGASISFSPYVFCKGGCTWPTIFASSTWRDNTRGDITFGTDTLQGWSMQIQGTTVSNWECLDESYFDSEGLLIIKSTDTFVHLGGTWTTFVCLVMTQVSENSYYYYQKHDQIAMGGNERGKFSEDGTITGKSTICGTTTVPTAEFHFMVKSGSESASKQYCAPSLLAKMNYTLDTLGSKTCAGTLDDWDVCTDRTTMTFNYTLCESVMAYSSGGEVYCMFNLTSTYEYTVVYNTDNSPTYRFACIVSNSAGTEASVVYNNCTIGQTPTSNAKLHDGSSIGALVTMTAKETCPFLGPSTGESTSSESSGSILPMIIGAIVGILVIAIIIAILVYCFKCKKKSEVTHNDTEKPRLPEEEVNGINPALNDTPAGRHTTLTPLPPKPDIVDTTPRPIPPITNHV